MFHRLSLFVLAVTMLTATLVQAQTYVEDFTTTTFRDEASTTADWNTAGGELRLAPFAATQLGAFNTSGAARDVFVSGDIAYVADNVDGLKVIDVSDPANPVLLGSFNTSGFALGVTVVGDLAYVADSSSGLQIIEVSDPTAPTLLGTANTTGFAAEVVIAGAFAYVADVNGGLAVINVSNPAFPFVAGSYNTPGVAQGLRVAGDYAFIADESLGLHVVDISDPTNPVSAGFVDTPGSALRVAVDGNYAFIADAGAGLQVIDISDPTAPSLVGAFNTPDFAYDVEVAGDRAYVADDLTGIMVFDITNPAAPSLLDTYDTTGSARAVFPDGALAFVAGETSGLQIVEIAAYNDPVATATLALTGVGAGDVRAWGIAVDGNHAFVADDAGGGLQIIDISDPAAPIVVGTYDTPGLARGIAVDADLAFVAEGFSGLLILDVADVTAPALLGSIDTPGFARRVAVSGDYAYVADETGGLLIFDVSDPTTPSLIGSETSIRPHDLALAGKYVYVADLFNGLRVVDVSDPVNPFLAATAGLLGTTQGLGVAGDYAFVPNGSVLSIVDVSNPLSPVLTVSVPVVTGGLDAEVVGDRVVVGGGASIEVFDISDPTNPVALTPIGTSNSAYNVAISGQLAFCTADADGLRIVQIFQDEVNPAVGIGRSLDLDGRDDPILRTRVSATQTAGVEWELSVDGGTDFEPVALDVWTVPAESGSDLRWRSAHTWVPGLNPTVTSLTVDWLYESPTITSVTDIPNDQGRQVRVTWSRSAYDFIGEANQIVEYAVYRMIDPNLSKMPGSSRVHVETLEDASAMAREHAVAMAASGWDFITTVPVRVEDSYSVVVPTLADSTIVGGDYSTTFLVSAITATPGLFYDSPPDSGYSVDNLAPSIPANLVANVASGVELSWTEIDDEDFQYYTVYRDVVSGFVTSATNRVDVSTVPSLIDVTTSSGQIYYYVVTATDFAGNESAASGEAEADLMVTSVVPAPFAFTLGQNRPNPFNPSTTIFFDLPKTSTVTLTIYDSAGRRVRTLLQEYRDAGSHETTWRGVDDQGASVSSGVYFYELRAGSLVQTRRMTVLK